MWEPGDPVDLDEEPYEPTNRRWFRAVGAVVIVAMVVGSSYYISGLFSDAPEGPAPGGIRNELPPHDRPAAGIACGTLDSLEPVDGSASTNEQIAQIEDRVETLRELTFRSEVETEFLSPDEIEQEVIDLNTESYPAEDIDRDEKIYEGLGLIPKDAEFEEIVDSLAGQVAGFYEPDTERLVVGTGNVEEPLSATAELTLAHELQHALSDQVFELPFDAQPDGEELDTALAHRSLIEGEATLLSQHYAAAAMSSDAATEIISDPALQEALTGLSGIPIPVQRAFEFPYTYGFFFVCDLYNEGGWAAVDAAYEELPMTSAQILFPHRYATREEPLPTESLGDPGDGWELVETASLGAADLLVMFEAPGGEPRSALKDPLQQAAAWGGGELKAWSRGRSTAMGLSLTQRDADDGLCDSMHAWYFKAFPDSDPEDTPQGVSASERFALSGTDQSAVLVCSGDSIRLGIGPDIDTARSVAG